jgi:isoleucyl-tRNA synthetase
MAKRLGNYPEANEVFATYGADAMRWFLISSAVLRGQDQMVDHKGFSDAVRQVINPIWNAWYFLTLYANTDGIRGRWRTDATGVLDRYALAKTSALVEDVTSRMDADDLPGACAAVTGYLDALTNWYIRRSRDRFWKPVGDDPETDRDKRDAYDTLASVLRVLCQVAAPLLPLVTEAVFRGLTGERSVHLTDWPAGDALPADPALVADMDLVREVASAGHSVRKANDRRTRLPLASLTVAAPDARRLEPFVGLIADEVNVQDVRLTENVDEAGELILAVDPSVVGPRLGADTQKVLAAARQGNWARLSEDEVEVAGVTLGPGEFAVRLRPRDEVASRSLPGNRGVVTLDLEVTRALARLGLARDVIRTVQIARRDAGLHLADHIRLVLDLDRAAGEAVESHRRYLMEQTLADELELAPLDHAGLDYQARYDVGRGRSVGIGLSLTA